MRQFANETPEEKDVTISVSELHKETLKAICIKAPDDTLIWIPRSQIDIQRRLDSNVLDIVVPRWLYDDKEMESHGL